MKYIENEDKIIISCREFVSTARRGISATLPADLDEPEIYSGHRSLLKKILGDSKREPLSFAFECSGHRFEMHTAIDKADEHKIWFVSEIDCDPHRPRKEYSAQLRGEAYVTAHAYSRLYGFARVELNFVFINSRTKDYAESCESVTTEKLEKFFVKCAGAVALFARPEIERVTVRVPSMKAVKFPYKARSGQSEFVKAAYRTIARGGTLYATAPTGTGKTVSALFPAIRAMGEGIRDKTFYLTPKETGAKVAIDTLNLLSECGAVIRAIKLTAKEKSCKRGLICRGGRDKCDRSKCNNISAAILELYDMQMTVITQKEIDTVSQKYTVCPYELALTYSELCDVVICDVNYLFDPIVYIHRFFSQGGNYTFLVDEAHNLPDRAREMYSAEISRGFLLSPYESDIIGECSKIKKASKEISDAFYSILFPYVKEEIRETENGEKIAAAHLKDLPSELYEIFDSLLSVTEEEISINRCAKDEEKEERIKFLYNYYYEVKKFRDTLMRYDTSYETFIFFEESELRAKLFCIDTGSAISNCLSKGRAAVFFSATLTPIYYYKSLLGGDGSSDTLTLESPFEREQVAIRIMDKVSTRYSEREDTLLAVCRCIAATVSAKRGNYMIFSPSFAYSEALSKAFSAKYPKIKTLTQTKNMSQKEKESFLSEFSSDDKSYLIGFCVMGGVFSEGINLVGDSLIGAVIVGIGMPSLSYEREAICAYFDEKYEEGKQFAYVYPGMNRVLQAGGRVIRHENDKGVIVLIDDRFDDPIYKKTMPELWRGMKFISDAKELREELDEFWREEKIKKLT